MKSPSATLCHNSDEVFEHLLEEITCRFQAGESIALEDYAAAHPEYEERLQQLLPAMQVLLAFGSSHSETTDGATISASTITGGVLGDFRILRELGRGGMGVVYEAQQISLGRRVALKVLPYAALLDARQLERFQNEARVAASLHHTHIVPVYTVGSERGVYFYAMQFIAGRDLAGVIADLREAGAKQRDAIHKVPSIPDAPTVRDEQALIDTHRQQNTQDRFRQAAAWAADAAEALGYAHSVGVLHRDIKPANLLVDEAGAIWISDFGLARLQSDASLSCTGDVLGTLRYMSPEQASGDRTVVDARSDLYSLGVTLYELLTLESAFPATARVQLLADIVNREPPLVTRIDPRIPADLAAIVRKAIEKSAGDRYPSAEALAGDLRNFLAHRTISAKSPTLLERTRKWARRHKSVVQVAAVATIFVAIGGLVATALMLRAYQSESKQRAVAETSLLLAAESIDRMLSRVAGDRAAFGDLAHAETLAVDATEFYEKLLRQGSNPDLVYRAAEAYKQIGVIWITIGQYEKAAGAHRRAKELLTPLAVPDGRAEHQAALAENYMSRAQVDWSLQQHESAADQWRSALAIYEQLSRQHPQETEFDVGVSDALGNLGLACWATKKWGEAEILFARSMALEAALPEELKRQPDYWESRGTTLNNWAMLVRERGEYDRALAMFEDSIALQQRAFAAWNADPTEQSCYRLAHWNIAATHAAAGRHAAAAEAVERLVTACPRHLSTYVSSTELLLQCAELAKDDDVAAEAYRLRARELLDLADDALGAAATAKDRYAWFLVTCEDHSFRNIARAIELAEQVVKEVPERGPAWFTLALARYRSGEWQAAETALENSERFAGDRRANAFDWLLLAMIRSHQGKADEAHKWHDKAIAWIAASNPTDEELLHLAAEAVTTIQADKKSTQSIKK